MHGPRKLKVRIHYSINHLFDFLRALADLSFGVPSAGNPSWVPADVCQRGKSQPRR